jgi:fatty-acyl-CoA synthase
MAVDRGYLNFGRALRLSADRYRDLPFLEHDGTTYTFAELNRQVNQVAHALAGRGVGRGDRVLLLSANSPDYVRTMFAAAKLGAVSVPTNTALLAPDLAAVLKASAPTLLLAGDSYRARAQEALGLLSSDTPPALLRLDPDSALSGASGDDVLSVVGQPGTEPPDLGHGDDEPAALLFTSGSSGVPKAVVKSFANVTWHAINRQLSQPRHEGDRELFVLPLTGVGFGNFLLTDAMTGATCVLEPGFDATRAARLLAERAVTHVFLAPTMALAIDAVAPGASYPDVRVLETAYEVTDEHRRRIAAMFPNAGIYYSYGCTEGSMARAPRDAFLSDPTCVGFASGLDEYRVTAGGESSGESSEESGEESGEDGDERVGPVEVAGPTVMLGYLSSPDADPVDGPGPDGWFDTGDLGWVDGSARLHFAGRRKDMIKSGAMNVYARDVEVGLLSHPDVADVAVLGIPDDYWGEAVVAVVQPRSGAELDAASLRAHAAERLAGFRRPKAYFLIERLPLNATGKLAKGQLRDQLVAGALTPLDAP